MKVLWVTNVPLAAAAPLLGQAILPFGGWLEGSLRAIRQVSGVEVAVAFPGSGSVRSLGVVDGTEYIEFPPIGPRDDDDRAASVASQVMALISPDVVHIHGTEMPHAYAFASVTASVSLPTVVSIQGLVSIYALHMSAFLPASVVHGVGTRPWIRSDRVAGLRTSFEIQGRLERKTLQSVSHVIGRTAWDRICTEDINPKRQYHHCDEILRPAFYSHTRSLGDVLSHSILVGQGHYPIKGLHLLLDALPAVLSRYPDTLITVAGHSPVASRRTPYGRYVVRLIRRHGIGEHIRFVGPQSENEMVSHYKRTHILVCPSVIENSPNSVAEGMILGVPVVAAHVGGVPDMLTHGCEGLTYQSDAPYMLAHSIIRLFENPEHANEMGARARMRGLRRHDPSANAQRTVQIYTDVARDAAP